MPAMYPEALRRLREQNPGLQFDFRGNLIDDGGYGTGLEQQFYDKMYGPIGDQTRNAYYGPGNLLGGLMSGGDGYSYQNDQFVGPVLPGQQQGYRYSDYDQAGPLQPGVSNLSLPNVGFYSQWDPGTNSWVRHGSASDGLGMGVPRRRASGQNGDPYGLRGFTPYVEAGETPYRDMWRGSPETTETFPNLARTQE